MARHIIAYVSPGPDERDRAWVLGAIANDGSGWAVEPNPGLDVAAAAAATELDEQTLRNWADTMRDYIANRNMSVLDEATGQYGPLPPTDERFLGALIADSIGEWNYHYSKVADTPGSAAEVARKAAAGVPSAASQ